MNILVTGSAGFIGMHTAIELLKRGHNVVGLDNLNDYYDVSLKEARVANIKAEFPSFRQVTADLCDRDALQGCFCEGKFDTVVNLAAQAGVRYSITHPHVYEEANLQGFLNILEVCRHHEVPKLVYASSSSVYGGNTKMPFSESDPVDHPISLYAATKKANELMAHTYTHLYGLQTIGLRFFTVYGPWGRPDMAMWLFTEAMLKGEAIKVFNHGNMQRDFTYVDDIVAGVDGTVESTTLDPYELFNIGNNRSEKLMTLISIIAEALGIEPQMKMMPMQPGDVPATFADIERLNKKVGYEPTTPISVGVPRFVQWYREYHGIS